MEKLGVVFRLSLLLPLLGPLASCSKTDYYATFELDEHVTAFVCDRYVNREDISSYCEVDGSVLLTESDFAFYLVAENGYYIDAYSFGGYAANTYFGPDYLGDMCVFVEGVTSGILVKAGSGLYGPSTPSFSSDSGFYDEPFDLSIDAKNESIVYYTLDGSTPDRNSNRYWGPIRISDNSGTANKGAAQKDISPYDDVYVPNDPVDKCTIVKAISVSADDQYSPVVTKTYFVGYQDKAGYQDLPVMTLSSPYQDIFGYVNGIYVKGLSYDTAEGEYKYPEEHPANYNNKGKAWERKARMGYYTSDHELSYEQDIGIRIHGGWSRSLNQKSFNLYARDSYSGTSSFDKPFFGEQREKTVMLRNGGYRDTYLTKTRDTMVQDLVQDEDISTTRNQPVVLFLNGEYWGIYQLEERPSDSYLEENYGIDKDNAVIIENGELDEGKAEDIALYEQLVAFFKDNSFMDDREYAKAGELVDIDSFMSYMATELYIGNVDWPGNNVRIWRTRDKEDNPYGDNRWRFMLYDTDDSMGIKARCTASSDPFINDNHWIYGPLDDSCLMGLMFTKLLVNESFKASFKETFNRIADRFKYETVKGYLDNAETLLATPMTKFYKRFVSDDGSTYSEDYFKGELDKITSFFEVRKEYAVGYLEERI